MHETAELERMLAEFFGKSPEPVVAAYLFGSRAAGRVWAGSDIDIAVVLEEPDAVRRFDLAASLQERLDRLLPRPSADIVTLEADADGFAYEILRTGRLLFCKDEKRRARLEAYILDGHLDRLPMAAIVQRYLGQRIRQRRMLERTIDMVDRGTILELLAYIQEMLNRLGVQQGKSFEEFSGDFLSVDAATRELQTLLEAVSDIATHIVAGGNLGVPADRPQAVELLARGGVLGDALSGRLAQAVRMCNMLVHRYPGIQVRKIHDVIRHDLGDIVDFCAAIMDYLDREVPQRP